MKVKNCFFIFGDDTVEVHHRSRAVLKTYFQGNPPPPIVMDNGTSYKEYESQIGGQSLFASNTAVILENPFFLGRSVRDEKQFASFLDVLKHMGPETCVVIVYEGKPDKRMKGYKSLSAVAQTEECSMITSREAPRELMAMLRARHRRLDREAGDMLEAVVSSWSEISRPLLESICDKIEVLLGDSPVVTEPVLEEALPGYMGQDIFTFYHHLAAGDVNFVVSHTKNVFTDITSELKNIGFIASQFRKIKMMREMGRNHVPAAEIRKRLGFRSTWAWNRFEREARPVSEETAEWMLDSLFTWQYQRRVGSEHRELSDLFVRYCLRLRRDRAVRSRNLYYAR